MGHPVDILFDDGEDGQGVPPDHVGIALGDRLEQRPVQGKGSRREVGAVEGFRPEGGEGLAHLRQKLPEERVVGGFVDREMEGEVLGTGGPLGMVHPFHLGAGSR